jgi:hypothetical protein
MAYRIALNASYIDEYSTTTGGEVSQKRRRAPRLVLRRKPLDGETRDVQTDVPSGLVFTNLVTREVSYALCCHSVVAPGRLA